MVQKNGKKLKKFRVCSQAASIKNTYPEEWPQEWLDEDEYKRIEKLNKQAINDTYNI